MGYTMPLPLSLSAYDFDELSCVLHVETSEPHRQDLGPILNRFETPTSKVLSCSMPRPMRYTIYGDLIELTAEELSMAAARKGRDGSLTPFPPVMSLKNSAANIATGVRFEAKDGFHFKVGELFENIAKAETIMRDKTVWFGGVDAHHVFFEGLDYRNVEWEVQWGSFEAKRLNELPHLAMGNQPVDGAPFLGFSSRRTDSSSREYSVLAAMGQHKTRVDEKMETPEDSQYTWTQNESEVVIEVKCPIETEAKEIDCTFGPHSIKLSCKSLEKPLVLQEKLFQRVDIDGCTWTIETSGGERVLQVTLSKEKNMKWLALTRND